MRQSAWLKRLGCMLRAKGHLVKLPYSCALVSRNQTNQTDRIDQIDQLPATRREMVLAPSSARTGWLALRGATCSASSEGRVSEGVHTRDETRATRRGVGRRSSVHL